MNSSRGRAFGNRLISAVVASVGSASPPEIFQRQPRGDRNHPGDWPAHSLACERQAIAQHGLTGAVRDTRCEQNGAVAAPKTPN